MCNMLILKFFLKIICNGNLNLTGHFGFSYVRSGKFSLQCGMFEFACQTRSLKSNAIGSGSHFTLFFFLEIGSHNVV